LKAVKEHRTILLLKDVIPDYNCIIRANAKKVLIKCSVVEFAERQAICDNRIAARLVVRHDMSRVK